MPEYLWAIILGCYVVAILYATKIPYNMMVERGVEHIRAVYYNRKIVHVFAGGIISLAIPYVFTCLLYTSDAADE